MRKIAFFGIFGNSRYTYSGDLGHCDAMPRGVGTHLANLLELYNCTDNKGNMIHGEAPSRIFELDRHQSCYVSVGALLESGWGPERISEELSKRFDLVVFSTANAIRPNLDMGVTAQILDSLRTEFIIVGIGMQKPLPPNTDLLHPNLIALLDVCNRKAKVFWVRGLETEKWLKAVGFDRATALGCPSLYVYPQNILEMKIPDPAAVRSAVTGGYINGRVPRSSTIIDLFKGFDAHYVMQEEMSIWKEQGYITDDQNLYNDATGEVQKEAVNSILESIHDEKMPFSSYRWFQDPNAWRMFSSRFDFYLGDRLHGGIAALQTGVPSLLMVGDRRVMEIVDFFGIPNISIEEAEGVSLRDIIAERMAPAIMNRFKEIYMQRFSETEAVLREANISLMVRADSLRAQTIPQINFPPITGKRRLIKMIRRWLRRL